MPQVNLALNHMIVLFTNLRELENKSLVSLEVSGK